MNVAYMGVGGAFIGIGGASFAQSRKAEDETKAKNSRIAGILMMLAGFIFMATGALAGN